ncbi:phosphoesterase PA-phosphatase [Rhabdochromatium marinum]|nr:phosphoesterase PA-phosphatase [Rhabdochromatium marinum]
MAKDQLLGVPYWLWIAFFACADLMLAFPELDLAISRMFFDPQAGFVINGLWWERLLYHSLDVVLITVLVVLLIAWWRGRQPPRCPDRRADHCGPPTGRQLLLLLALLALVPGLLVNQGLKEHLGRARPVDLSIFGGTKSFTPAFVPSTQDGGSFSSGHAAAAFFLVVVAAELRSVRSIWFVLALSYALSIGLIRIASGGHFLSDVLASALLVWIGYRVLLRH